MLRTPAHRSSQSFLEVLNGSGISATPEALTYAALHRAAGIQHADVDFDCRIKELTHYIPSPSFDVQLRTVVIESLRAILKSVRMNLDMDVDWVIADSDNSYVYYLRTMRDEINTKFNDAVKEYQKAAKNLLAASVELYVARNAKQKNEKREAAAEARHEKVSAEFAEVEQQMIPVRKIEAISRYLNVNADTLTVNDTIRIAEELIRWFPDLTFRKVLALVDRKMINLS